MVLNYLEAIELDVQNLHDWLSHLTNKELTSLIFLINNIDDDNIQLFYSIAQHIAVLEGHENEFNHQQTIDLSNELIFYINIWLYYKNGLIKFNNPLSLLNPPYNGENVRLTKKGILFASGMII